MNWMAQTSIEHRDRGLTIELSQLRLVTLRREMLVDKSGLKREKKQVKEKRM